VTTTVAPEGSIPVAVTKIGESIALAASDFAMLRQQLRIRNLGSMHTSLRTSPHSSKVHSIINIHMENKFITTLRNQELEFITTWGLFSPKQIDKGTSALMKCIEWPDTLDKNREETVRSLDLGCGYGPIGITLAKDWTGKAPLESHLIDKDFVAIEYAQKNAEHNGVPSITRLPKSIKAELEKQETPNKTHCQIYLSNAFYDIDPSLKFDLITSNIPAKVGKDLLIHIVTEAHKRLEPGGRFYIVTISGLKDFMKRNFKEIFGNYKKCKSIPGYTIAMAEKV
jgi:16S rRNA (guanine1207-N2)-methyltransferase